MKWFRRKRLREIEPCAGPSNRIEALASRPVRNREVVEEKLENGEVLLTYPLSLRPWLIALTARLGLRSSEPLTRKLQLDEMGSLTWALVDGNRTVQDMVELIGHRYNLNRRESEVALSRFLRELGRRGLIGFQPPPHEANANSA